MRRQEAGRCLCSSFIAALAGSWPSITRISVTVIIRSGGASESSGPAGRRSASRSPRCQDVPLRDHPPDGVGTAAGGRATGGSGGGGGVAPTPETFTAVLLPDRPGPPTRPDRVALDLPRSRRP